MSQKKPNVQLKGARLAKNWTQSEACEAAGVADTRTWQRWELESATPSLYYRRKICATFNKTPEELGFLTKEQAENASLITTSNKEEETTSGEIPSNNTIASNQVIILTPDQVSAFQDLLYLGNNEDMTRLDAEKRKALSRLFQAKDNATQEIQPTLLTTSLSRRSAITTIIGTTAAALGLSQDIGFPQLYPEEALLLCASNIPLCWSLYFEGGLAETKKNITPYLTQLTTLVSHSSSYRKQAATLASQAYQLSAVTEILFHNLGTALDHAKQAIEFAELTDDSNLKTAAQIRLAVVLSNLKRPRQRLVAYENALQYCDSTSPLLKARVYSGLTETYSVLGNEKAALRYLEMTGNTTPSQYEADPNYSYTHFDSWSIDMYQKDMWLNLGNPQKAWDTLEKASRTVELGPTVNRTDLTIKQAEVSVMLGNLEQSRSYLINAVQNVAMIGSQLLKESVDDIYQSMRQKWPHEKSVLDLETQLV